MSQQVRQDAGLLALVSQMRTTGGMPWADQNLDTIGIESAANQAFVIWVYKTLLPTISWRYVVTNCFDDYNQIGDCDGPVAKPGIVGGKPNFTIAGHWFQEKDPCSYTTIDGWWYTCIYWQLPDALLGKIWNPLPSKCIYQPGQSINQWTFDCPSGDDVKIERRAERLGLQQRLRGLRRGDAVRRRRGRRRRERRLDGGADQARPAAAWTAARGSRPDAVACRDHRFRAACGWRARRSGRAGCCSSAGARRADACARQPRAAAARAQAHRVRVASAPASKVGAPAHADRAAPHAVRARLAVADRRGAGVPRAARLPRVAGVGRARNPSRCGRIRGLSSATVAGANRVAPRPSRALPA